MANDIEQLEKFIHYEFKNKSLLLEAVTHRSYSAEKSLNYDNQRLEFLGDSVLEIVLTEYLYLRYSASSEGELTKMRSALVRQDALAEFARKLRLNEFLLMGRGEIESGGSLRDSTLADAFESLVGALYLDSKVLKTVSEFIMPFIELNYPDPEMTLSELNPKGALQEYTQKNMNTAPVYNTIEVSGPDHDPSYKVSVSVRGKILGTGTASKRKTAEGAAARNALLHIRNGGGFI